MLLKTRDKETLEKLFQMRSGGVLDFSISKMKEFFNNDLEIQIYDDKYNYKTGSKANRLRGYFKESNDSDVALVITGLIDYIESKLVAGAFAPSDFSKELIEYCKGIAKRLSENDSIQIAVSKTLPKNWENTSSLKAFISHRSEDKKIAKKLQNALGPHSVKAFVAHEDIKPSERWEEEIKKALNTMDIFVSIHTKGFSESMWCQQEIGYAVALNTKIIPINFGENPNGFIGKFQALYKGEKRAEQVAKDIINILKNDERTKYLYNEKIKNGNTIVEDDGIPF